MQAILLATNETEKLRPLTDTIPSPLIPIANRPVMEIMIEFLAFHGIKKIIVCLYQSPASIESYFGNGRRWGVALDYVLLREPWGTAGSLRWASSFISEEFIVLPGDEIIDLDIQAATEFHKNKKYLATIITHEIGRKEKQETDQDEAMRSISDIDAERVYCETGACIFEPQVIDCIPPHTKFDIHSQLLPTLSKNGSSIGYYLMDGYWNQLESFQDVQEAQKTYLHSALGNNAQPGSNERVRHPFLPGRQLADSIWVGKNTLILPGAHLTPPVLLGDNTLIGEGAELGPEVILGTNVIVDEKATIQHSTVLDGTYVGQFIQLDKRLVNKNLVIDFETSEHIRIQDSFLLSRAPQSLEYRLLHRLLEMAVASLLMLLTLPLALPIGLLLLLFTGKIFQLLPRVNYSPFLPDALEPANNPIFYLTRFHTRDGNGAYTMFGKFLEGLEWHRLPELWNVIKGDMRLVGVKPLAVEEEAQLVETWQQRRNDYYPGFTGLWYVQTDLTSSLEEILVADVYYVATRSWKEDFRILWETPKAWFDRITRSFSPEFETG